MKLGTIYLTGNFAPGGKDWHSGYIAEKSNGVHLYQHSDARGPSWFYYSNVIQRINYDQN
jgi:hypothetical protein